MAEEERGEGRVTQGLLSITREGKTLYKIVVGCNGYNLAALKCAIEDLGAEITKQILYDLALEHDFGCRDCLVVQGRDGYLFADGDLSPLYAEKFDDPAFNPRWHVGTADHSAVIEA